MARGPSGEKRPADAVGCAVMVGKIATGEVDESLSPARVERARMGGQARMAALSGEQRSEISRRAAGARWSRKEASMTNSGCTDLASLFEAKRASGGLIDAKFLVSGLDEATTEEICQDVAEFTRAIESGEVSPLDFGDKRWREVPAEN